MILICTVLLLALGLFLRPFWNGRADFAEIVLSETRETETVRLDRDAAYTVTSRGMTLTVCVANGAISVSSSDCRDGICTATPPISRPGQSIVCAPAGIVIRITGEGAIVDGVSG